MVLLLVLAGSGCRRSRAAPTRGLSAADYDRWRRPDLLVAALALQPGQTVADVGAGRGYLTRRLAAVVGAGGRVVATDIDPVALAELERIEPAAGEAPIEARRVEPGDPGLEPGRYDLVLLAQVDHLLADRADYLNRLRTALGARGRIAVSNRLHHRAALHAAASKVGLRVVSERDDLPGQYLVILEKP